MPLPDSINPIEVVRQLGLQPVHKTADINSSATALTQGCELTHTQGESNVAMGEVNHHPQ